MQEKKYNVWLPFWFSLVMIAGIFFGYKMRDGIPGRKFFSLEKANPVNETLNLIKEKYVDTVNLPSLSDTAIEAILSQLDPHSIYIPPAELEEVNEDIAGNFFGIGIEYNIFNDTLNVIHALRDGPGAKAGIQTGDQILSANGHSISGNKTTSDSIRILLRGPQGSPVRVTVLRDGQKKDFTLTRDLIPVSSVDASYMLDSATGYIRLNKFSQQTHREFAMALEELKKKNMKNLVFDLRGNGGGVLEEAIDIADEFLSGDKLITYTEGAHMPKKEYRCKIPGLFEDGKLVVLADMGSASASEVILGALRDWKRATIIGKRSFGKGLVQDQFELSNGGAIRLTVAKYYTPLGRSIQRSYAHGAKAYYEEISDRYISHMPGHDSLKMETIAATDSGGIAPDIYIPFDTAAGLISAKVFVMGTLNNFGYFYFLGNKTALSQYRTPSQFGSAFHINSENWESFSALCKKDSIDLSRISPEEKSFLSEKLKSSIARQLWQNEGYYEIENKIDPAVLEALKLFQSR